MNKMAEPTMNALVIVNWDYVGEAFEELMYPEHDGDLMEAMLGVAGYKNVKVVQNTKDINSCIQRYKVEHQLQELDRFHFHYSGTAIRHLLTQQCSLSRSWSL